MTTVTQVSIVDDAAAWQNVKTRFPGTAREELDRIELGERVADALNGGTR